MTREEWYARGLNERDKPPFFLTDGQLLELQFRLGAGGRRTHEVHPELMAANGRKTFENKLGVFGLTPEQKSEAGRTGGRKNVESGHLARMRALPQTKKTQQENGRVHGYEQAANKIGIFSRSPEQMTADGRKAGRIAVESGQWGRIAGLGLHTRWHIKRGIIEPTCQLCCDISGIEYVPLTQEQKTERYRKQSRDAGRRQRLSRRGQ